MEQKWSKYGAQMRVILRTAYYDPGAHPMGSKNDEKWYMGTLGSYLMMFGPSKMGYYAFKRTFNF